MKGRTKRRCVRFAVNCGNTIVSVALLVVIVLSTVALSGLYSSIESLHAQEADNRANAARLEQEIGELEERIEELGSAESVKDIAREELDLEDPDSILVFIEEMEETN